jgi:hypothetical protein
MTDGKEIGESSGLAILANCVYAFYDHSEIQKDSIDRDSAH